MLTKVENTTTSSTPVDPGNFRVNYTNSSCETNWTTAWLTFNIAMSQQPEIDTSNSQASQSTYTPTNLYKPKTPQSDPFQLQSFIKLFRCQTKLTHSTHLHQQTTDALNNVTKFSPL